MTINATVVRILGPRSLLVRDNATGQQIIVQTPRPMQFRVGDNVRITYSGQMSFSNPPRIAARSIVRMQPQPTPQPSIRSRLTNAQVLSVQRGLLAVRDPQTGRIMNVRFNQAHHFCVNQRLNINYDSISLTNPPTITATDISPVC